MENKEALETLKHQLACAKEEDCINDYCEHCPHDVSDADFIEALTIAISALEKQEQDRWHSVAKEGNPKKSGFYIVVDKNPINGNEPHTRYFNAYGDASFWSGWKADEVIAWKEITSEPYKTEEES